MKISKTQLREITDRRSWDRGVGYYQNDGVLPLLEDKNTIIAKVSALFQERIEKYSYEMNLEKGNEFFSEKDIFGATGSIGVY